MILTVRHGERGDKSPNEYEKQKVKLYYDPHLTEFGSLQAQITGMEIKSKLLAFNDELKSKGMSSWKKITPVIITSPFLRTIQTAYHIARNLDEIYQNTIFIQNEIAELLWDQQEFDLDPLPILLSRTQKLEDFRDYGVDFLTSGLNLKSKLFSDPEFIQPKYPEQKDECIKRVQTFLKKVPKLFFEKFKFNKYVLICVTHQFTLAAAMWFYEDLTPLEFPDSMIPLCGIVNCRFDDQKIIWRSTE